MSNFNEDSFSVTGRREKNNTWIYQIPNKTIGTFDDLEHGPAVQLLNLERYCFRGFKANIINVLQKEFKFRVTHGIDLGKREGQLPNGKKDGQKSAYTLGTLLAHNNFVVQVQRVQNQLTTMHSQYKTGNLNLELQGQIFPAAGASQWEFGTEYRIKDTWLTSKLTTAPSIGFAVTQPITEKLGFGTSIQFHPIADKAQAKHIAKYEDEKSYATLGYTTGMGSDEINLVYSQEVLPALNLVVASDFSLAKTSPLGGERDWGSVIKGGYMIEHEGVSIQGMYDSAGNVRLLSVVPFSNEFLLTVSGQMNNSKNLYDFGVGIQVMV